MSGRLNFYFRQKVSESELDLGFTLLEQADRAAVADAGFVGVYSGMVVTQHAGGVNLTADVSAGVTYDKAGARIANPLVANVDVSRDENGVSTAVAVGGNFKIISIFAQASRLLTDLRSDGNGIPVYFNSAEVPAFVVRQSAESTTPTGVLLDATYVLLADITVAFGQTTIVNVNIATTRREDVFVSAGAGYSLRTGTVLGAFQSVVSNINDLAAQRGINNLSIAIAGATYVLSATEYANGIITIGSSIVGASLVLPDPVAGAGRVRTIINNSGLPVTITTPFNTAPVILPTGVSMEYALTNTAPGITAINALAPVATFQLNTMLAVLNGYFM